MSMDEICKMVITALKKAAKGHAVTSSNRCYDKVTLKVGSFRFELTFFSFTVKRYGEKCVYPLSKLETIEPEVLAMNFFMLFNRIISPKEFFE